MKFNRTKFFAEFRDKIDSSIEQEQVDGLEFLLGQMESDPRWKSIPEMAYALATIFHETASSMQPVEEGYYLGSPTHVKAFQKTLRYYPYFGRGYVQLTWETKKIPNYSKASNALGIDFVKHPDLVMEPKNAYEILTLGMHEGWFTGKKLSNYISDTGKDYKSARQIINGLDKAGLIAGYANTFEQILRDSKTNGSQHSATAPATSKPTESLDKGINNTAGLSEGQSSITDGTSIAQVEITPEGAIKASTSEGPPPPKERIAVVKTKPQKWFSRVTTKITAIITGSALFQWIWSQSEKLTSLPIPDAVWIIVSSSIAAGSLLWIIYEIVDTWRDNKYQENIDKLLIQENSTPDNNAQLIPADEVELYRLRGYKIITRGEPGIPLRALTTEEKAEA